MPEDEKDLPIGEEDLPIGVAIAEVVVSGEVPEDWDTLECIGCHRTARIPPGITFPGILAMCPTCAAEL